MKISRLIILTCLTLSGWLSFTGMSVAGELTDLIKQEKASLNNVYKVCHEDLALVRKATISYKAYLLETSPDKKCLYIQLDAKQIAKLQGFGFTSELALSWIYQRQQALDNLQQKALSQETDSGLLATDIVAAAIPGYSCYETVEETFAAAQSLATAHPTLASWIDVGDSWEKENAMGGYDMMVLKLTNSAITGAKPILFVNSAIHAREYATTPLVLNFAKYLVNNYGIDADATWILDYHEIHLLLHTNPDGRKKAESGLSWRKNTNTNYCGVNSNNRGADLNRNFTFGWNSAGGSSGNECDETYRGPYPASEPETQAVESYVRSIYTDNRGPNPTDAAPDDTSGIHLDIHSYSELVLWPWGTTTDVAPNGIQMQTLGRKFAFWNGYSPEQAIGLYPTDGTSEGVSYGELGVPAFTFELGTAFFQSCTTYTNTIVPDNMPALIYAAKVVRTPYITPGGPNTENVSFSPAVVTPGTAVTLTATASDLRFNNSNGTEATQNVSEAEYYLGTPPWVTTPAPVAVAMNATDGGFNEKTEEVAASIDTTGWSLGKHMIFVRARDAANVWGAVSAGYLTISDDPPPLDYCTSQSTNQNYEWIAEVNVGSLSNGSGASPYSDFTSLSVELQKDTSIPVSLLPGFASGSYAEYWRIWIDLNRDGDFDDTGEAVFSGSGNSTVSGSFTVPVSALTGPTRMRVSMEYNAYPNPCGSFTYGEVEDYTVSLTEPESGPKASFTFATDQLEATFTDTSTSTGGSIISWDWNFGDGTGSTAQHPVHTYTTAGTYTVSLTVEDSGGLSDSISKDVAVTEIIIEYCTSQGNNYSYEWIDQVDVGAYSHSSGAAGYSDFTSETIQATAGASYAVTLSPGFASSSYREYWKIWVDFNRDGDFTDTGEELFAANGTSDVSGTINIPAAASVGNTRMRVSMRYNATPSSCGSFTYGEVEDYTLSISE